MGGGSTTVSPSTAYQIYNSNPSVSDAVDMIALKSSEIIPIIRLKTGDVFSSHKALDFLEQPNNMESYHEFVNNLAINYLLNRNAYIEATGFKKKMAAIYNVRNSSVSVISRVNGISYQVNENGFFHFLSGMFEYDNETGRIFDNSSAQLKELYHMRGFYLSSSTMQAVSVLTSLKRDAEVIDQTGVRNLALLTKGFSASGLIRLKTDNPDAFEQVKNDVKNFFSGAGNAGNVIVAQGDDIDYKSIEQSNKDMQSNESRKTAKDTIYQRYDIPQPLIDAKNQTYNNYQTALYSLYDNSVLPLCNKINRQLTTIFRNRGLLNDNEKIDYDISSIPALQIRRNEELKSLKQSAVLSINEMRAIAGYEGIDSGGDDIYIQNNSVPVGQDSMTDDNRTEPSKKFMSIMKKNNVSGEDITRYWNEYKALTSIG